MDAWELGDRGKYARERHDAVRGRHAVIAVQWAQPLVFRGAPVDFRLPRGRCHLWNWGGVGHDSYVRLVFAPIEWSDAPIGPRHCQIAVCLKPGFDDRHLGSPR